VVEHPASFMAFDLLAAVGVDIRQQCWDTRRSRLESLAGWVPPLQLTPVTFDVDEAREWYEVLPAAMGVEGLVIKARHGRYAPARREWWKVNSLGVGGVGLGLALTGCEVSTDFRLPRLKLKQTGTSLHHAPPPNRPT
jgi:ATP-dependent DNA ligase